MPRYINIQKEEGLITLINISAITRIDFFETDTDQYGITIYAGNYKFTEYFETKEELDNFLIKIEVHQ